MIDSELIKTLMTNILGAGYNSETGEIEFVKIDTDTIETSIISLYEMITQRTLGRADPVRLFLLVVCYIIIILLNCINYTGKQNLLKYAVGDYLDEIGYLVNTKRKAAVPATTTLKFTLSEALQTDTVIPKGTRVTADGSIFFATDKDLFIQQGQTEGTVSATCTENGEVGNDYLIGQINTIVDVQAFVSTVSNITVSAGGSEIEEDDVYRERIHVAPESFSVAGPNGAYEYWAKTALPTNSDVKIISPEPGKVSIYVILENGELPEKEVLDNVLEVCNDTKIRPLTDNVSVLKPEVVSFDVDVTYYLSKDNEYNANAIKTQVEQAVDDWILWTKAKIGRDINVSELIRRMIVAGAKRVEVNSPEYTKILEGDYDTEEKKVEVVQLAVSSEEKTISFGGFEND